MRAIKLIPVLASMFFFSIGINAQNTTEGKIEEANKVLEKSNETVEKTKTLVKSIFGKKKKNKEETASPDSTNSSIVNAQNNTTPNKPNESTAGSIHPDAVSLDVDQFGAFNNGLAIVKKGQSTALIDSKGVIRTPFNEYNFLGQYAIEGLQNGIFTTLSLNSNAFNRGFEGFITSEGKEISTLNNHHAGTHVGKYILVKKNNDNVTTFYDKMGKNFKITGYSHSDESNASEKGCEQMSELFKFKNDQGKFGFKDKQDKIVIQSTWEVANCFFEGAALVGGRNDYGEMKYGFVDEKGNLIVPLMFSRKPENFSDGLAKVYSNEKICSSCHQVYYGYINKKGEFEVNSKNWESPGMSFSPFFYGYSFNYKFVLDKENNIISCNEFLISLGIPKDFIDSKTQVEWNYKYINDGKMQIAFGVSTFKRYHALVDLKNKKTLFVWYADAKIGPFDAESGLALVEEYGDKVRNDRKKIGYINEDGVFVIVKGQKSKW